MGFTLRSDLWLNLLWEVSQKGGTYAKFSRKEKQTSHTGGSSGD